MNEGVLDSGWSGTQVGLRERIARDYNEYVVKMRFKFIWQRFRKEENTRTL